MTLTMGKGPGVSPSALSIISFVSDQRAASARGAGFGSALAKLVAVGQIEPVRFRDIAIYEGAEHPHKDDCGLVMVFRKL